MIIDVSTSAALFDRFDVNGNGALSLAEVGKAVRELWPDLHRPPALMRAFQHSDTNGSGLVGKKEFTSLLQCLELFVGLHKLFANVDVDHDGTLTVAEFKRLVRTFVRDGGGSALPTGSGSGDAPAPYLTNLIRLLEDVSCNRLDVNEAFGRLDKDGGGKVRFDEMCSALLDMPSCEVNPRDPSSAPSLSREGGRDGLQHHAGGNDAAASPAPKAPRASEGEQTLRSLSLDELKALHQSFSKRPQSAATSKASLSRSLMARLDAGKGRLPANAKLFQGLSMRPQPPSPRQGSCSAPKPSPPAVGSASETSRTVMQLARAFGGRFLGGVNPLLVLRRSVSDLTNPLRVINGERGASAVALFVQWLNQCQVMQRQLLLRHEAILCLPIGKSLLRALLHSAYPDIPRVDGGVVSNRGEADHAGGENEQSWEEREGGTVKDRASSPDEGEGEDQTSTTLRTPFERMLE